MARRSNFLAASLTLGLAALSVISCGSNTTSSGNATCTSLMSYASTVPNQLSFATDVYPILTNTATGSATAPSGCAQTLICHGDPPLPIDTAMTKTLHFTDPPATVRTALLGMSVNAPTMAIVVPGNVQNSFMAYKISGTEGLSCVTSKCMAGATVDTQTACGAPMPSNGTIAASDRTKILDWIASGAAE
jgi:hypothetical protein